MRSMGHPDYRYRPMSEARRAKLSVAQRKRWGAPDGFATVRGVHVPLEYRDDLKIFADRIAQNDSAEKAREWVQAIKDDGWRKMPDVSRLADEWRTIGENRKLCLELSYGGMF